MPAGETAGFLHDDAPYLKIGHGPPLVMVPGMTPEHDVPKGWQRRTLTATWAANARLMQSRTAERCCSAELTWACATPEKRKVGGSTPPS
jgi:hypothetical protein